MDRDEKRQLVEALILASPEPITPVRLAKVVPHGTVKVVKGLVEELNVEYIKTGRAFEISEVAGGLQMRTLSQFAPYLKQVQTNRPLRLSSAALETLSVVAYRQPVTRAEVEQVRGVDAGPIVRGLLERQLVRIAGHREVPGRPMLYTTTKRFLEVFGLSSLEDLPTLRDLEELNPLADPSSGPGDPALDAESDSEGEEENGSEDSSPIPGTSESSPERVLAEAEPVGEPH